MTHHQAYSTLAIIAAGVFTTSSPLHASEADERIESTFVKTYAYKTYLKDDAIAIDAEGGVVTLTGTVAETSHKTLAQETVASLPGVTRVDNQLATKAEAAAEGADIWIRRKIEMTLLLHRNVSSGRTTVAVKDGVVTLTGEAVSAGSRDLTSEYAKDIDGVTDVRNDMTVAATETTTRSAAEQIDDASITSQIRLALATHRSTRAMKIGVEARNGEVVLTGTVTNAAEKALLTKLVADIQGVTGVNNLVTLVPAMSK